MYHYHPNQLGSLAAHFIEGAALQDIKVDSSLHKPSFELDNSMPYKKEKEERMKQRRTQIALASRKSRAKRKREHAILKEENELLLLEVASLRKRLRNRGEMIENKSRTATTIDEPLKKKLVMQLKKEDKQYGHVSYETKHELRKEICERMKNVISPSLRERLLASIEEDEVLDQEAGSAVEKVFTKDSQIEEIVKENPFLSQIFLFFEKQLIDYFSQLKHDVLNHFNLSISTEERHDAIKDLGIRLFSP